MCASQAKESEQKDFLDASFQHSSPLHTVASPFLTVSYQEQREYLSKHFETYRDMMTLLDTPGQVAIIRAYQLLDLTEHFPALIQMCNLLPSDSMDLQQVTDLLLLQLRQ